MILGIDEVGRGPWAGPLVVGAVVLPNSFTLLGLTDSKKLSAKKRAELDKELRTQALGYGLGWVHASELDNIGLSAALRLATMRAIEAVTVPYHEIIIDGTINFLKDTTKGQYVTTLAKADALIPAVSAASIIAKVARDTYMSEQALAYPHYGFEKHVGYGTAYHADALQKYGVSPLHRKSFAPIARLLNQKNQYTSEEGVIENTIGARAEQRAVDWFEARGFTIIERNWKTKYCEIDIIAEKEATRYFIEVKYRSTSGQGGAIAAITPQKLKQMSFAAEIYQASMKRQSLLKLAVVTLDANPEQRSGESISFITID